MPIQFACPYCDEVSSVPDSFAGKKGKCPACNKVIEVPNPNVHVENSVYAPEKEKAKAAAVRGGTKECPYCGETIKKVAKKCRYCGEFLDKGLRRGRSRGPRPQNYMGLAIMSALMCCTPIGVVAIIYAVQVDQKYNAGDLRGAQDASGKAKSWGYAAVGLGLVGIVAYMGLIVVGG